MVLARTLPWSCKGWVAILALWASTPAWAAASTAARAEITADGSRFELVEQQLDRGVLQRSFRTATGTTLYRSVYINVENRRRLVATHDFAPRKGPKRRLYTVAMIYSVKDCSDDVDPAACSEGQQPPPHDFIS